MKASWEPPLLFMALINLAGSALAFVEVLVFPGLMLLGNAGIFFVLLDKVRKQEKRHAPDNAPPSAAP
ncbi:hypothetical protein A6A08_01940 [Nocardiopsis sp. TSRI0078]|uniref:hypothetical protein n=1 Tax=unclassified Nocardiopsis TaxID=2649073 RepID=UPI00093D81BB|nr:hypothetical protein [Nocardiopsis sp. TSRI0078]OKI23561.1 hypothetical protein A6A08_01940 [Nocardiopsis sp. TSRI0078]